MGSFLAAIFLTAIFGINQCAGIVQPTDEYPWTANELQITDRSTALHLTFFWLTQQCDIEKLLMKELKCPAKAGKESPIKCKWLQDLGHIAASNTRILRRLETRTSKFADEHVEYLVKAVKSFDSKTIEDLRKILSYASQFNVPINSSILNIYGSYYASQTVYPPDHKDDIKNRELSYYGLLRKYQAHVKTLDNDQLKKLGELTKIVSTKMESKFLKVANITIDIVTTLKTFYDATQEIGSAIKVLESGKDVPANVNKIKKSIEVCKKEMKNPSVETSMKTLLKGFKQVVDEVDATQQTLPRDIEEILKVKPKKFKYFN